MTPLRRQHSLTRPDRSLAPVRSPALLPLTEMLADEYHNPSGLPAAIHTAIVRHVLSIFLLRIGSHGHRSSEPADAAYEAFRRAVEDGFTHTHPVEDYAHWATACEPSPEHRV
jgi:hypothetical protein